MQELEQALREHNVAEADSIKVLDKATVSECSHDVFLCLFRKLHCCSVCAHIL